jgi:hypothetical protein
MTLLDDDSVSRPGASKAIESSKRDGLEFNQAWHASWEVAINKAQSLVDKYHSSWRTKQQCGTWLCI